MESTAPLVFVTVGTDHHPFDRLIAWVDAWLADGGSSRARVLCQYGTSRRPELAESVRSMRHEEFRRALSEATVVVSHGGPGTIMQARAAGVRPIVVPRRRDPGEHVDDHQVAFVRRLASAGDVVWPQTLEEFRSVLDDALAEPSASLVDTGPRESRVAIRAVEHLVGDLLARDADGSSIAARRGRKGP